MMMLTMENRWRVKARRRRQTMRRKEMTLKWMMTRVNGPLMMEKIKSNLLNRPSSI